VYRLRSRTAIAVVGAAVALALTVGCATSRVARQGELAARNLNWDGAVYYYLEALARDPQNIEYQMALARARQKGAQEHFKRGMALKDAGRLVAAQNEFQMAVQLDPTHQYAAQELQKVRHDIDILSRPNGQETLAQMKAKAAEAKVKPPLLNPRSREPISLSFPKPKSVKEIYRAMGKAYGFNVLFDPKLKDDKLSIELKDVTAEQALEIVMQAAGHFYKVLDEHTIIIADDTPQNRRDYEDLVIKTFFLSNADVKDVDKMLRSLIEARRIATNEQLNAITLRDTADKVAIAEKLIDTNDKAKAEVMVDVELMEVNSSRLQELGTKLETQSFGLNLDHAAVTGGSSDTPIRLNQLSNITNGAWSLTVPNVIINLVKSTTDAVSLAQPQMRITEGEKGSLVIGKKEPVPVTSFNTSQTVGGNIVPITSYQYQDVGIKITVEPRVHHNREVTLKITVEVSQVSGHSPGGQPIIGTRNIDTVIRLQDGETNMLVGLYKEDRSSTKTKIPLLSDIPLLGRLFTNDSRSRSVVDLVLTLTPHIIRYPDIREADLAPLWVGTEKRISYYGNSPRIRSGSGEEGPFGGDQRRLGIAPSPDMTRRLTGTATRTRRVNPARGGRRAPGVSLVPSGGLKKESMTSTLDTGGGATDAQGVTTQDSGQTSGTETSQDTAQSTEAGTSAGGGQAQEMPLLVSLEPSAVSLRPGDESTLQLMLDSNGGTFRMPLTLSYDSARVELENISAAPGVIEVGRNWNHDEGWITLDLIVTAPDAGSRRLATLRLRGRSPGPAPLSLSSDGAVSGDGAKLNVGVTDGAAYVLGDKLSAGGGG